MGAKWFGCRWRPTFAAPCLCLYLPMVGCIYNMVVVWEKSAAACANVATRCTR